MIGPEEGLADIKPLLPFNPSGYWAEILIGLTVVALGYLAFKLANRYRGTVTKELAAGRSRKQIAEANNLFRAGKLSLPDYCSRISLIVRSYLQTTRDFPATNMTAAEISKTKFDLVQPTTDLLLKCEARAYVPNRESAEEPPILGTEAKQIIDKLEEALNAQLP